jgi:outer membrane protein OmpA-like peptidoglycan-associated protein
MYEKESKMSFKLSLIASSILIMALNAAEMPVEQTPTVLQAPVVAGEESATLATEEAARQKEITKKMESAAAKKIKEQELEKTEKAKIAENKMEVEAAKKTSEVAPKDWHKTNITNGTAYDANKTVDAGYEKTINKSEYSHILPVAVEKEPVELDHDHDGVPTSIDKCPTTPLGRKVDSTGCELDGDKDGVVDADDKCPTTPLGRKVDINGCEPDSDGDGVFDMDDQCPDTPKLFKVNLVGCPVTAILKVNFDTNKYNIKGQYSEDVTKFAQFLKENEGYNAIVSGHTDAIGSDESNMVLSQNRANSVKQALVKQGVNTSRLSAIGEGENRPVADNLTVEGRAENRRIEVELKTIITDK